MALILVHQRSIEIHPSIVRTERYRPIKLCHGMLKIAEPCVGDGSTIERVGLDLCLPRRVHDCVLFQTLMHKIKVVHCPCVFSALRKHLSASYMSKNLVWF